MAALKMKSTPAGPSSSNPRRRKWVIIPVAIVGLLLVLYFFLTSAYFIKSFVLPKASKTLNAQITVEDISVSPFSSASLRGLKVAATETPFLTAESATVRYSLLDIMRGKMNVSELKVQAPHITFVQNADGASNLDPVFQAMKKKAPEEESEDDKDEGDKPVLNLRNLALEQALIKVQLASTNGRQSIELSNVNLGVDQIITGTPGKLTFNADLLLDQQPVGATNSNHLAAKAAGDFEFIISPELAPQSVKGKGELKVGKTEGTFADLNGLVAALNADVTPTEVKSMRTDFSQNGEALGAITVTGPMDLAKGEAKLNIQVEPLGKRVLNLAGAALGYDFGSTQISSTNLVEITRQLTLVNVNGQFNGQQFTLVKDGAQVAPLDMAAQYSVRHDKSAGVTQVEKLNVNARQKGRPLLDVNLAQPITVSSNGTVTGNSVLVLKLTQLDVADWKPLAGAAATSGSIDANAEISFAGGGKEIEATFQTTAKNLLMANQTNAPSPLNASLRGKFSAQNSKAYKGNAVANITGQVANIRLQDLQVAADLTANVSTQQVVTPTLAVSLQHGGKAAGSFDLSGTYNPTNASGKYDYTLSNLNENLLASVFAPFLTDATLTSVTINSKGSLTMNPGAESAVKADLQVTRLLVTDKAGKLPKEPLSAVATLDAGMNKQVMKLRTAQLNLTPTDRAKNVLNVTGTIDSTVSNAITGNLKISSDGLDLTRYYDLFTGTTSPTDKKTQTPPPPPADPNKEPDAVTLPFKNFTAELDVKKLYLREVAAENWQATVLLDGSNFKLDPARMTLNGAPLSARFIADMSVPGFRYDISAKAEKLPLAPLANSFEPDYKDRAAGDLFADLSVKGAGFTDKSLQKNLAANVSLNFTNANIQIVERGRFYPILAAVALALQVPEVLNSPLNAIGADMKIGTGQINIDRAIVYSPAFLAGVEGKIPMSDVLTNSPLNLPVNFQLATNVARHFVALAATNSGAYAPLPGFLTVKGTIGSPKPDVNERVAAGLLLKSATALPIDLGDKGNSILKGVGNILSGQKATNAPPPAGQTNNTSTNSTQPNKPSALDVIDLFRKKKQ